MKDFLYYVQCRGLSIVIIGFIMYGIFSNKLNEESVKVWHSIPVENRIPVLVIMVLILVAIMFILCVQSKKIHDKRSNERRCLK